MIKVISNVNMMIGGVKYSKGDVFVLDPKFQSLIERGFVRVIEGSLEGTKETGRDYEGVNDIPSDSSEAKESEEKPMEDISSKSKRELVNIALSLGIKSPNKMRKEALIKAINEFKQG